MDIGSADQSEQTIVVLNRDLFFGIRLNQLLKQLGYRPVLAKSQESFISGLSAAGVALGIIDINFGPDWNDIAEVIAKGMPAPIIAFG